MKPEELEEMLKAGQAYSAENTAINTGAIRQAVNSLFLKKGKLSFRQIYAEVYKKLNKKTINPPLDVIELWENITLKGEIGNLKINVNPGESFFAKYGDIYATMISIQLEELLEIEGIKYEKGFYFRLENFPYALKKSFPELEKKLGVKVNEDEAR